MVLPDEQKARFNAYLEKQKEPNARQRLAEWSKTEEGKAKYEEVAKEMREEMEEEQKPEDRFKEAREKYQVEWSEENKIDIELLISLLRGKVNLVEILDSRKESIINFLKSLYPSWKPSEEQMRHLHYALTPGSAFDLNTLNELYEQLKKL